MPQLAQAQTFTTLFSFDGTDGYNSSGALVQATDGNLYGTTALGGGSSSNCDGGPCGTVFKITPSGALTTLHSFDGTDGEEPVGLVQSTDGNLYGIANSGGAYGYGSVFKITLSGKLTTLYSFCPQYGCVDGSFPAALIQATNGNFYGTTNFGGGKNWGTAFEITPSGALTTLYSFCSQFDCADGYDPVALVQATDGSFYGATAGGGANVYDGTVFKITPSGALTTLHSFDGTDGAYPGPGALVQATNGSFYGTTESGGAYYNYGTVYSLSVGLGPFVETQPTSGKVGAAVKILGTDLTGATSVMFNGTAAVFKVVSSSEITTKVPEGTTTGTVTVTTPSGTLDSNLAFRVTPQITSFTPTSGPVETVVTITGVSLTQTTEVTFGGKVGTFTVNNDSQITATVPTGAKTGKIVVTTLGGTATSATSFTVTP